jgi:hypothetical protein
MKHPVPKKGSGDISCDKASRQEDIWESGYIASPILNLGTDGGE